MQNDILRQLHIKLYKQKEELSEYKVMKMKRM